MSRTHPNQRCLLLICGSLRAGSSNEALLRTAASLLPSGVATDLFDGMGRLPHFNPDDDLDPLPAAVVDLRARIGAADAILISTPEYAGAMPGSFKGPPRLDGGWRRDLRQRRLDQHLDVARWV